MLLKEVLEIFGALGTLKTLSLKHGTHTLAKDRDGETPEARAGLEILNP